MTRTRTRIAISVLLAAALLSPAASANVMLPMWAMIGLPVVVALVPVIVVEAIVLALRAGLALWDVVLVVVVGNIASTVVGVLVVIYAPIVMMDDRLRTPGQDEIDVEPYDRATIVEYALYVVLCLLVSWKIEAWVAINMLIDQANDSLSAAILEANMVSYLLLAALIVRQMLITNQEPVDPWVHDDKPGRRDRERPRSPRYANYRARLGIIWLKSRELEIAERKSLQSAPVHDRLDDIAA